MYKQVFDPVGDSLFYSSLFALIPIVTLFVLLGGLRMGRRTRGARSRSASSILVAIIVYGMPVDQTLLSASEGAVFGLFPIMWIVWTAIWIYNMTEATGHFAVLRRAFSGISNDQRIQAVIIAFCFGALLEALAGFGTPVAITAVMLVAVGFQPMKAAAVALVANTAPVAFGAIAIPIVTLSGLTDIPKEDLGAMVGRQTPFLALIVPLILVGMVDGWRGVRAVARGARRRLHVRPRAVRLLELHLRRAHRHRRLAALGRRDHRPAARVAAERSAARRARRPRGPAIAGAAAPTPATRRRSGAATTTTRLQEGHLGAFAPYIIIIAVFSIAQIGRIKTMPKGLGTEFGWPGLNINNPDGEPSVDADSLPAALAQLNLNVVAETASPSGLVTSSPGQPNSVPRPSRNVFTGPIWATEKTAMMIRYGA